MTTKTTTLYSESGEVLKKGDRTAVLKTVIKKRYRHYYACLLQLIDGKWIVVKQSRKFVSYQAVQDARHGLAAKQFGWRQRPTPKKSGIEGYEPEKPKDDDDAYERLVAIGREIDTIRDKIQSLEIKKERWTVQRGKLSSIRAERNLNYEQYQRGIESYRGSHWNTKIYAWRVETQKYLNPQEWAKHQAKHRAYLKRREKASRGLFGGAFSGLLDTEPVFIPNTTEALGYALKAKISSITKKQAELRKEFNQRVEDRKQCNYILIRVSLTNIQRREIWTRDQKTCHICGDGIDDWSGEHMHIDHVVPFSKGGTNDLDNLKASHPRCNLKKADKTM